MILVTDFAKMVPFHSDVPGSGVGLCVILLRIFLSYPAHRHTLVTCIVKETCRF